MSITEALGRQHEIEVPQGRIQYRESGQGQPIVFIHGLLVNGDLWRKVVPSLAQHYRCIVPDLPLGAHTIPLDPQADLTPPGLARLIRDFILALKLDKVTLVANDTGGAITQILVTEYPELCDRLILTSCDAYENFLPLGLRYFTWGAQVPGFVSLATLLLRLDAVIPRSTIMRLVAKYPVEKAIFVSYVKNLTNHRGIQRDMRKVLKNISNRYTLQAATKFPSFKQPVLLVWARKAPYFGLKYGQRMAQDFPNAQIKIVDDSFVFLSEDQPEQVVKHVLAFLEQPATV